MMLARTAADRGWSHAHHPPNGSALRRILLVEGDVELQHVDPGLADEAEPRGRPGWSATSLHDLVRADAAGLGHPVHLQIGVGRRDVRIQSAAAGGDGVRRAPRGPPGPRRGSARSDRSSSRRRTWRTRRARPRRCSGTASGVVSHGSLTLTTLVGCTTLPRESRGPITGQHGADALAGAERA